MCATARRQKLRMHSIDQAVVEIYEKRLAEEKV